MRSNHVRCVVLLLVGSPVPALASTYYVSVGSGSNGNAGTDPAAPLTTLQYAEGLTRPGDTVLIMDGTYVNEARGDDILLIDRSGTADAPITYAAYPGAHPVLAPTAAWAAIRITASYIIIDGFEIAGNAASITGSYAKAQSHNLSNPMTNGDGIDIEGPSAGGSAHHVTIENMLIHDVPGGGIAADGTDYVTIESNIIYGTSNWSPYGDSAISLYESADIDTDTGTKNVIAGNVTYDNQEDEPCACRDYQSISDGNGIIVDDNINTQDNGVPYDGRTLVTGNVSYDNGGSGIHAFSSQHVDIVSNTAYGNNTTPSLDEGQIFAASSSDVNIVDDILVAPAGKVVTENDTSSAVTEDGNVLYSLGGAPVLPDTPGPDDIIADPLFVDPSGGNFALEPGSPAIGTAIPLGSAATGTGPAAAPSSDDRGAD